MREETEMNNDTGLMSVNEVQDNVVKALMLYFQFHTVWSNMLNNFISVFPFENPGNTSAGNVNQETVEETDRLGE